MSFQRLFKRCLQEDLHNCFTHRAAIMDTPLENVLRVAVKDNIAVKGMPLTCASPTLRTYQADYDADVVSLLRQHGAQVVGKTNMDEFGMGNATVHSIHGPTTNAWNPRWSAGGSSGGSVVAVALGLCDVGLGSDTGGSTRLPAACNRVVGFKPTYGRISRHGLVSYAPSMDCIGIAARTTKQVAQVFEMVKDRGQDSILFHKKMLIDANTKIAVPIELITEQKDQFMQCITAFAEERKMQVELISIPLLDDAVTNYYTIACVEASSTMARYTPGAPFHQITEPLGDIVQRRIDLGKEIMLERRQEWEDAMKYRNALRDVLFKDFQLIACPTLYYPEPTPETLVDWRSDKNTVVANLVGCPAISIPPVNDEKTRHNVLALQFMTPPYTDEQLLNLLL